MALVSAVTKPSPIRVEWKLVKLGLVKRLPTTKSEQDLKEVDHDARKIATSIAEVKISQ